jgi:Zn-dependent metallo-hydrolase RNA specificity domain
LGAPHQRSVCPQVEYMAFSMHTDSKGIIDLVRHAAPRAVVLVHGEPDKMAFLQGQLESRLAIPTYMPANGELVTLPVPSVLPVRVTAAAMRAAARRAGHAAVESTVQVRCAVPARCAASRLEARATG